MGVNLIYSVEIDNIPRSFCYFLNYDYELLKPSQENGGITYSIIGTPKLAG